MTPEPAPAEVDPAAALGLVLGDESPPYVVEVGDTSPPGELAEIKAAANPTAANLKHPW